MLKRTKELEREVDDVRHLRATTAEPENLGDDRSAGQTKPV